MPRQPFTKAELLKLFQNVVMNQFDYRSADYRFRELPNERETHIIKKSDGTKKTVVTTFFFFDVKIQGVTPSLFEDDFKKLNEIRSEIMLFLKVKEGKIVKLTGTPS